MKPAPQIFQINFFGTDRLHVSSYQSFCFDIDICSCKVLSFFDKIIGSATIFVGKILIAGYCMFLNSWQSAVSSRQ